MKKVLVAILDWGLGHATRCIPVIKALQNKNCEVLIAGSGNALSLLKAEFSSLLSFELPPYSPEYPRSGSMVWKMAAQLPKFIRTIRNEHDQLEDIIREHNVDLVIADNRYGCWSQRVPSVFMTHQRNILIPEPFRWLNRAVRLANERQMAKFTQCWIPDVPGEKNLSGELNRPVKSWYDMPVEYIGVLSRFSRPEYASRRYDVVAICSGPEPKRTDLEQLFRDQLLGTDLKVLLVRGVFSSANGMDHRIINYLTTDALQAILSSAELVIARSGYSTIMDMIALGKKFIGIPTPGQTEQEYLAHRLKAADVAFFMEEKAFELKTAMEESKKYKGFSSFEWRNDLLPAAIDKVLAL